MINSAKKRKLIKPENQTLDLSEKHVRKISHEHESQSTIAWVYNRSLSVCINNLLMNLNFLLQQMELAINPISDNY